MNDIQIDGLTLTLGNKKICENFSITFEAGKITSILAPSGSGKTTLLNYIASLLDEKPSQKYKCSFVFQEPRLLENLSIRENIEIPLLNEAESADAKKRIETLLEKVRLSEKSDEKPSRLSGGERQRAAIARAFAFQRELLLLDEPFQNLDIHIKIDLMEVLRNLLSEKKQTVIFVTHDIDEALFLSERLVVMKGSPLRIVSDEPVDETYRQSFGEMYTSPNKKNALLKEKIVKLLMQ